MQPPRRASVIGRTQPLLDEPEMRPEDMGHNGIGVRDVDHCGEQLRHSETCATTMFWQSQCAESCAFQCSDLIKWVLVVEVSVLCSRGDLGAQVGPFGRTGQDASHVIHGGHGLVLPTRGGGTHCFGSART